LALIVSSLLSNSVSRWERKESGKKKKKKGRKKKGKRKSEKRRL